VNIVLLSDIVRQKLLALLQAYLYLLPTNSFVAASFGAVAVVAIFTTARLCRFVRPDWPMLAPFLVWLSKWLAFPTAFAVAAGGVGSLLLSTLVAYSLGNSNPAYEYLRNFAFQVSVGGLAGGLLSIVVWFYAIPKFERRAATDSVLLNRQRQKGVGLLENENLPEGCFVGCTPKNQPVYLPWNRLNSSHVAVLGETGSGKGIMLSNIAVQCLRSGQSVVFFDPKSDRYSPKILAAVAKRMSKKFALLDLSSTEFAQVNPLSGCTAVQVEEMLVAGFSLTPTGTDGDYYRGKDLDAAGLAAAVVVGEGCSCFPALLERCLSIAEIAEQDNFVRKLRQLSTLQAVATEDGVDLSEFVNGGHVLYIVGSSDNERVKMLQKILLIRILQIIKARSRDGARKPVAVVLDEFKYLLSPVALNALGVVRDFDAHFFLGHQSMSDLRQCVGVDPEAAFGAVVDNTSIKIVHKISDSDYAKRLSDLSGTKKVFRENVDQTFRPGETPRKTWREDVEPVIKPEQLLRLPVPTDSPAGLSSGVIFGLAVPLTFQIAPIRVDGIASPAIWSAPLYRGGKLASNPEEAI
jgi:hypothetical protein